MKKLFLLLIITICTLTASAQIDTIRNFEWLKSTNESFSRYQLHQDSAIKHRQINSDSLQLQLDSFFIPFCNYYFITGDSIRKIIYQNISESGVNYERCWIFYYTSIQKEIKFTDIPLYLQNKYYYLSEQLKEVIKK